MTNAPLIFYESRTADADKLLLDTLLSERCHIRRLEGEADVEQYIIYKNGQLTWINGQDTLALDWNQPSLIRRRQANRWRQELLIKATGVQKKNYTTALDLTTGMGHDTLLLAASGMQVRAVERNEYLSLLLQFEAAQKKQQGDESLSIDIIQGDSRQLYQQGMLPHADVVYCDPMFPAKKKVALSTKAMQMMKKHVDQEQDERGLLDTAIKLAKERVVVKRPLKAVPLACGLSAHGLSDSASKIKPTMVFSGKVIRYDVYVIENIRSMILS